MPGEAAGWTASAEQNVGPARPAAGGGLKGNWAALWRALALDHYHAGLIWNECTRGELRAALAAEEAALR